jgi:hypothetical protein
MGIATGRSGATDCPDDEGKKKPQLLEQQPYVVACSIQYGMKRVTECTFEGIAGQSAVGLRVSDGGFDGPCAV